MHFQNIIKGWDFHILTDHKALAFPLKSNHNHSPPDKSDIWTSFPNLKMTLSSDDYVADALSWIDTNAIHTDQCLPVYICRHSSEQQGDPEVTQLGKVSSLKLQTIPIPQQQMLSLSMMYHQKYHTHIYAQ